MPLNAVPAGARAVPVAIGHLLLRHAEARPHLVPNAAEPPDAGPPRQHFGTCCCDTPSPHHNNRPTLRIHQTQALPGSNSALVATTRRAPTAPSAQRCRSTRRRRFRWHFGTCCCDTPSPHHNNRPTLRIHQTQALPGSNSALVAATRRAPTATTAQRCRSTRHRPSPAATRHLLLRHAESPPQQPPKSCTSAQPGTRNTHRPKPVT